jgi:hypothetical protein
MVHVCVCGLTLLQILYNIFISFDTILDANTVGDRWMYGVQDVSLRSFRCSDPYFQVDVLNYQYVTFLV